MGFLCQLFLRHADLLSRLHERHGGAKAVKREPKIPDVAEALGVHTMDLREFYDASGGLTRRAYPIQPAL